jgi:hypothetical protein
VNRDVADVLILEAPAGDFDQRFEGDLLGPGAGWTRAGPISQSRNAASPAR